MEPRAFRPGGAPLFGGARRAVVCTFSKDYAFFSLLLLSGRGVLSMRVYLAGDGSGEALLA